ncbi:hypothetical protein Afil01_33450 [Actinorhabdospora filicis]|uniref:Uncharacterized protein n=1 Tax=Actinorhabdospora filicis TaxID=1785913 RepID=A0A9W6SM63_9ACTN|nr:transcriptional regulator [Actinorhabdospora filicis]GLZ78538.1 hypothetical protein Afil01_33450 [Actinorhabdospora filicis]
MTRPSPPDLRTLHAVRLLGFADDPAIAVRAGISPAEASSNLLDAESRGWTQHMAFADLRGWSLTQAGKAENERRLAEERAEADPGGEIEAVHRAFLPLNARLLRACTDWQLKPTAADRFAPNDHRDPAWDDRVLAELAAIGEALSPLNGRLSRVLARFDGYDVRFQAALRRARGGRTEWVDKTDVDSCHRVWFQLHEDLIATLGVERGAEGTTG